MNEQQRELKRARDKRYRDKKKNAAVATVAPVRDPYRHEHERREVIDILRTGIRLKHRHQANRESAALEARVVRRLNDCENYGGLPFVLGNLQDVEEFAALTRREIHEAAGWGWTDGHVEFGEGR